jgi:hypothetical protein
MKKVLLGLGLIITLSFPSCTKEKVSPTISDQITLELQKVIKANGIDRIIAWDDKGGFPTNIPTTLGTSWSFSNGFITIGGYGFNPQSYWRNLLYLDSYEISNVLLGNGTTPVALILHFKS